MKRFFGIVAVLAVFPLIAAAAYPSTVLNYQGRLISGTNLVNGVTTNVFALWNTSSGGVQLYAETQSVTVVDGLYSTTIGVYGPEQLYRALTNFGVYLEVTVNGVALSPRERLHAAAYAVDAVRRSGDVMTGPLQIDAGAGSNLVITSSGADISIGSNANGENSGVAVGVQAEGVDLGVGIGSSANGTDYAVALGRNADAAGKGVSIGSESYGYEQGVAVGYYAGASETGVAVGAHADGAQHGVAVGYSAMGQQNGLAVGYDATGDDVGIAIGKSACGSHTNIAIGYMAAAGIGPDRIAIGRAVSTPSTNAAAIRGTLYLDGATGIYYRTTFGSGAWTAIGGGETATGFVRKTGDTMTGVLSITNSMRLFKEQFRVATTRYMIMIDGGDDVEIGAGANGYNNAAAVGGNANGYDYGAALGAGANGINHGVGIGNNALGMEFGVAVGADSAGTNRGAVVGEFANGSSYGAGLGYSANAFNYGAAVGQDAQAGTYGAALGSGTRGFTYGAAVGERADGRDHGVAVGNAAVGNGYSVSIGYSNYAAANAVSIGQMAKAYNSNIAIGAFACAANDWNVTAIGQYVTNNKPNSTMLRGTLFLDGATSILYRTTFGAGAWSPWTGGSAFVLKSGDTMTGPLKINATDNSIVINSDGTNIMIGYLANGNWFGTAVGNEANAYSSGAALGNAANGYWFGTAVGNGATGRDYSVAIGRNAYATNQAVAIGNVANGIERGSAVGAGANASDYGSALGYGAIGRNYSVAVGTDSEAARTNIAIGYNANALSGVERIAIGHNVTNSVDNSAAIRGTLYLDGATGVLYRSTFGTGTWTDLGGQFVEKAGDTMSGILSITTTSGLRIASSSNNIAIGGGATAPEPDSIALGQSASAYNQSVAIGSQASVGTGSVAVGYSANGFGSSVAVGSSADAASFGTAVGMQANGITNGVAVGYSSAAGPGGVAVGYQSDGYYYGAAVGNTARGTNEGTALGYFANGSQTNIAIGVRASATGSERVAIGHNTTNYVDNSIAVRGNLYLDGGSNVMVRSPFGSGAWSNLVHGVSETVQVVTNVTFQKQIIAPYSVTNITVQTDNWIFWNGLRVQ